VERLRRSGCERVRGGVAKGIRGTERPGFSEYLAPLRLGASRRYWYSHALMAMREDKADVRAGALIVALARRSGEPCRVCGKPLCAHELLFAIMLGRSNEPCCSTCAAAIQNGDRELLLADLRAHIGRRDCYRAAWEWAGVREGSCRLAVEPPEGRSRIDDSHGPGHGDSAADVVPDAEWDAGDMSCGDLVLELRARMKTMAPGSLLLVTAHDPGASEDLPAWCRMTGYRLVYARPPIFGVRNKER